MQIWKIFELIFANFWDNFTFEVMYLKFYIHVTDPHVLLCQNDTENISRQTGLIL